MLGMGNTFNFDGEDNYRHVIFLYSDLSCCQHSYRVKRSWLGGTCNILLWHVNVSLNCCGSVLVAILSGSEFRYFIALEKNVL